MTAASALLLLERLASETWNRLSDANKHGFAIGEETITDLNLLEIAKAASPHFRVRQVPKHKEAKIGADWLWWIGNAACGWIQYAVQAKKLDLQSKSYRAFRKPAGQLTSLEGSAARIGAMPIYCLYNANVPKPAGPACRESRNDQFGCTVVGLERIKKAYSSSGKVQFADLHQGSDAHPWRCLMADHCDWLRQTNGAPNHPLAQSGGYADRFKRVRRSKLPDDVDAFIRGDVADLPADTYSRDAARPKYVVVLELDNSERTAS